MQRNPCVCAIIDTELPVPPIGKPPVDNASISGPTFASSLTMNSMLLRTVKAHVALGKGIGDPAQLADGPGIHLPLGAGPHGPDLVPTR